MVEEDDEFTHDGGERDFLGFAGGDQPLIKRFQDRVEAGDIGALVNQQFLVAIEVSRIFAEFRDTTFKVSDTEAGKHYYNMGESWLRPYTVSSEHRAFISRPTQT